MMANLNEDRWQFLNTDMDLAFTFVELAQTELELKDREHSEALLQKARQALRTIRRLMVMPPPMEPGRIEALTERCAKLEAAIGAVK